MSLELLVERGEAIGLFKEDKTRPITAIRAHPTVPVHVSYGNDKILFYPHDRTHAVFFEKTKKQQRITIPETYTRQVVDFRTSDVLKQSGFSVSEPKTLPMSPQTEEISYKGHNIRFSALPGKIAIYEITKDNIFIEYGTRSTGESTLSDIALKEFAKGAVQNLRELNAKGTLVYRAKFPSLVEDNPSKNVSGYY